MSESYVTTETTAPHRAEALQGTQQTGVRFTPLRSAIVVRDDAAHASTEETLSPLVPVPRRED
ncbi:MAG: hypothetical protein QNJ62_01055 [Methyloceanibacter sp.]|nr:hypothetical protein [Methyloceanibacter sp.]